MLVLPLAIFYSAQMKSYLCANFQQGQPYVSGTPEPHKHQVSVAMVSESFTPPCNKAIVIGQNDAHMILIN